MFARLTSLQCVHKPFTVVWQVRDGTGVKLDVQKSNIITFLQTIRNITKTSEFESTRPIL